MDSLGRVTDLVAHNNYQANRETVVPWVEVSYLAYSFDSEDLRDCSPDLVYFET